MSKCECKNCMHYELCDWLEVQYGLDKVDNCHFAKDKSLCGELPVKLGQICYAPYKYKNEVEEYRVSSLTQKADGSWKIRFTHNHSVFEIREDEIGKTVFLTKEDAEAKLQGVGK